MPNIVFIGEVEKEIPQIGVFKPGDVVESDETLLSTGLFIEENADANVTVQEAGAE